jgi:RTX calcium-binding nonapeptide repeat (4 copies)/HYR domain
MRHSRISLAGAVLAFGALLALSAAAATTFSDVNPNSSDLDAADPDGATSGRVNGLASVAGSTTTFYAATEWGGIYKTLDAGANWSFLSGHQPLATWDVEVDPANTQLVYATSFFDGRTASLSGINISTDGGVTWTHPATAAPPAGFNCSNSLSERSAFGIGIRSGATNNVYVGTSCGLAISTNSGSTWTFVDPTPATPAGRIWDVSVQSGGVVDVCGDDGHFRTTDGGVTWTGGAGTLPFGRCSIMPSPDESYVLFVAAADNNIYESNDAGSTWTSLGTPDFARQGRIPFVATNQRSNDSTGDRFDLWYGDVSLYRTTCTTPATRAIGGANRCSAATLGAIPTPYVLPANWSGPFTRCSDPDTTACAHDDVGAILFDPTVAVDACPVLFSSDGGVFRNTDAGADCQDPDWEQPATTPHALWLFGMEGVTEAGAAEDLYMGCQDNGVFGSTSAGTTWHNQSCCDGFSDAAETTRELYVRGFFGVNTRGYGFFLSAPGNVGETQINTYPADGLTPGFNFNESMARFGTNSYVVLMNDCTPGSAGCPGTNAGDGGVYITTDISASPIVWTELGNATEPPSAFTTEVQVAVDNLGTPTFYVRAGDDGKRRTGGSLWKFTGTNPAGSWTRVDNNSGLTGGFNAFGVDATDPNRLYASNMSALGPRIVFSTDGGTTWNRDTDLETLLRGNGAFLTATIQGPTNFTTFTGYPQASMLVYDPIAPNIIVAGGVDSGVFISFDSGGNWALLTDPLTSSTSGIPHLPRPHYAHFEHIGTTVNVYIGTQGRGVWKLAVTPESPVALCKNATVNANATCQGSIVSADINNGSFDPDGPPPTCTPSSTGPFPLGSIPVTLNCVDNMGLTASCAATVTVVDATAPTMNCPVSVNANCTSPSGANVTFTASATDNCPGVHAIVCSPTSGSSFALGTRLDTCTASDAVGNVGTCNFNVTVALADNPVCCPAGTTVILGTSNNDTLNGGSGRDCILGRGGQDTINGNGGDDLISGGDGDDIISGGLGNDMIFAGSGQDRVSGNAGNDLMSGGDGDDVCFGGDNDDIILGGQGQDQLSGENGNDTLVGETGDDRLDGGSGDDSLDGDGLHDVCIGGPGVDTFMVCESQTQ